MRLQNPKPACQRNLQHQGGENKASPNDYHGTKLGQNKLECAFAVAEKSFQQKRGISNVMMIIRLR